PRRHPPPSREEDRGGRLGDWRDHSLDLSWFLRRPEALLVIMAGRQQRALTLLLYLWRLCAVRLERRKVLGLLLMVVFGVALAPRRARRIEINHSDQTHHPFILMAQDVAVKDKLA